MESRQWETVPRWRNTSACHHAHHCRFPAGSKQHLPTHLPLPLSLPTPPYFSLPTITYLPSLSFPFLYFHLPTISPYHPLSLPSSFLPSVPCFLPLHTTTTLFKFISLFIYLTSLFIPSKFIPNLKIFQIYENLFIFLLLKLLLIPYSNWINSFLPSKFEIPLEIPYS